MGGDPPNFPVQQPGSHCSPGLSLSLTQRAPGRAVSGSGSFTSSPLPAPHPRVLPLRAPCPGSPGVPLENTAPKDTAGKPGFLTRRFLTLRFPLLNEHKIFPCCQLLGSFVLLRAALAQGKSPPEPARPLGRRESPGWVSPGLRIPTPTTQPDTPSTPSPWGHRHHHPPMTLPHPQ